MPLIGVSIAVPDPCGSTLQDFRVSLGDPDAQRIPTHITLVPPGEVLQDDLPTIVAHLRAAAAQHQEFTIQLRGTGTFRPVSPVVFVNLVTGISECELLAKSVRTGPLERELEFPYHPHVTVAHDLPEPRLDQAFTELADMACAFEVTGFWLYLFDDDAGWVPSQFFDLTPG